MARPIAWILGAGRRRIALLGLALLPLALQAEWTARDLDIDGTPVKIVLPDDYVKAPDDDPGLNNSRALLPDYLVFANFRPPKKFQFVQVQMHKVLRDYRYSTASFGTMLEQTKAALPKFDTKNIREEIDKRMGNLSAIDVRLMKPVMFPISSESERHFIVPVLLGMDVEQPTKQRIVLAGGAVSIALNGRLLFLQVFLPYEDKNSISRVSQLAEEIAQRTLAANK